ncbi:MAG: peptidylprolyl isomerase [Porticoccaceae bacterium]
MSARLAALLRTALAFASSALALDPAASVHELRWPPAPQVRIETDAGDILIELAPARAPISTANFLQYVDQHFYDGVIFHRVIKGFMVQTGGYGADFTPREPGGTVANESVDGLPNRRGAVAMARTSDPASARAQFFINLKDNRTLDAEGEIAGYTVFGQVIEGMEVVDKIAAGALRAPQAEFQHLPVEPVRIHQMQRVAAP